VEFETAVNPNRRNYEQKVRLKLKTKCFNRPVTILPLFEDLFVSQETIGKK